MKLSLNRFTLGALVAAPLFFSTLYVQADSTTNSWMGETNRNEADADNSQRNERDRNHNTMTPGDQGNSQGDIDITRQIRQSVVSRTNNFSMMAQNIKIITAGGKVTLRGPVKSADEKERISTLAQNIAGANNVNDQIEVKANQ